MELRDIKYLNEIAKTGSFLKAAENLFISQPALSQSIKKLESDLGFSLFKKDGTYRKLTPLGTQFLEQAQAFLYAEQQLNDWLVFIKRRQKKQVHLGVVPYYVTPWTTDVFYRYQKKYPEVEFIVSEMPELWIQEKLLAGKIDVGFTENRLHSKDLLLHCGFTDTIDVAFTQTSPLYGKNTIQFSDLVNETFHMITSDSPLGDNIKKRAKAEGFTPKIGYMGSQVGAILTHIRDEGGICLLNRPILQCNIALNPLFKDIQQLPLNPMFPCYCWVYTKDQPDVIPEISTFVSFFCNELEIDLMERIV